MLFFVIIIYIKLKDYFMSKLKFLSLPVIFAIFVLLNFISTSNDANAQKPNDKFRYIISVLQGAVNFGDIEVELYPDIAPQTCLNFDSLVSVKFYDGTAFHRVIPNFMIQGGDMNSKTLPKERWGMGDPSQHRVPAEFNALKHERGVLSMARSNDPNSATSQFFIVHGSATFLDGKYTGFGKVVKGIEVVDKVCSVKLGGPQNSAPEETITMTIKKK